MKELLNKLIEGKDLTEEEMYKAILSRTSNDRCILNCLIY